MGARSDESWVAVVPRVYGPIPLDAVVAVHEFPPNPDGTFTVPASIRSA